MSRFRIFSLFATLVVLAVVFAACGGGDDDGGGDGGSGDDPQQLLENAGLKGVKSGELEMSMHLLAQGENAGELDLSVSGPFEQGAKGELPQVGMTLEVEGTADDEEIDFDGGITLLTDRAFVDVEGDAYEVDPTTFGFVKAAFEQAQQQGGEEEEGITACQEAGEEVKFTQFSDDLENEGSADVGGTETTKLSGDLNVSGGIGALIEVLESPACASQLEAAGPLPFGEIEQAKGELSEAIKESHVDLYVGEDDIVRKAVLEMTIAPPEAKGEKVEIEIEATLTGVNEEQEFATPSNPKPLEGLYKQLGVNPLELLEGLEGQGLEGLLEGLLEGETPSGGASSGGAAAYSQCLREGETAADFQKCANQFK